jgi:asparagine synthase (glutamine-hydrolysing)
MCGIAGIARTNGVVDHELLSRMSVAIKHRGPDDHGLVALTTPTLSIGLASRRLSIIDLSSAGHMPMQNPAGDIWLVYNGEIYNHNEIRTSLSSAGIQHFRSRTDTETLLYAYQRYGLDAFNLLDGIFSVAIADQSCDRLILARDRMGVKPLYYTWDGQELMFASEIKALLQDPRLQRRINPEALQLYLSFGYVPSPYTLILGINKLEPGHFLILQQREIKIIPFWQPALSINPTPEMSKQDLTEHVKFTIEAAIKAQMIGDVPIGVFLSGGLDSTIIAAQVQRHLTSQLHTFSVGFNTHHSDMEDIYNLDRISASKVAAELGVKHHEVIIDDDHQLPENFKRLIAKMDEPLWEPSYLSIYVMSELAKQYGIKVLLTGDGADELFGGYPWYNGALRLQSYQQIPALNFFLAPFNNLLPPSTLRTKVNDLRQKYHQPTHVIYMLTYQHFTPSIRQDFTQYFRRDTVDPSAEYIRNKLLPVKGNSIADQFAYLDTLLWVREHFNTRVDRMTMLASIEGRVPYQANSVVDLAFSFGINQKISDGKGKIQLKQAFKDSLPQGVISRAKRPFAAPAKAWLFGALRQFTLDELHTSASKSAGILDDRQVQLLVERYINDPQAGRQDQFTFIQVWNLLCLSLWFNAHNITA